GPRPHPPRPRSTSSCAGSETVPARAGISRDRRILLAPVLLEGGGAVLLLLVERRRTVVRTLLVGAGRLLTRVVVLAEVGVGALGLERIGGERRGVGHGGLLIVDGTSASHHAHC